ncbi:MAG: N-acetylmuramic acid 6-phosphate etherase [Candidatus Latescibacterota bacterium]
MSRWAHLLTEQRNPLTEHIDEVGTLEVVALINREDARVAPAVARQLPAVARAADLIARQLWAGGRLFYMGAGTSGRLGVLDASECPPTFDVDPDMVQGLIAGGPEAAFRAVEGAEDREESGAGDLCARGLTAMDVVMGIAASGVTPYVLGGLQYARRLGCGTIFFTCSPSTLGEVEADIKIAPQVGPEVITGSTRMKAGTATKLVLNMISTAAMVRLGKTYGNLMVDLQPRNAKLRDRMVRILSAITELEPEAAARRLTEAGGRLKVALVMELCAVDAAEASRLLQVHRGVIKEILRARQG